MRLWVRAVGIVALALACASPSPEPAPAALAPQRRKVYLTWLDGLSWYVTLSFSIPISMARCGPRAEAEIYETASGRLVWRSRVRGSGDTTGAELADALFEPLELAWPRVLSRPLGGPEDRR